MSWTLSFWVAAAVLGMCGGQNLSYEAVNGSRDFSAKPGSCPTADGRDPESEDCVWDMDCSGWQRLGPTFCIPKNTSERRRHCLNATVTVEADHQQLMSGDEGLLNHARFLRAIVTGALQPDEVSIYYFGSWAVHPHRTATSLLLHFGATLPPNNVTSRTRLRLQLMPEVSAVTVEDVDDCHEPGLHLCSPLAGCSNTLGFDRCICHRAHADIDPSVSGASGTAPPSITSLQAANVTGTSFRVHWFSQNGTNQNCSVYLSKGPEVIQVWETSQTTMTMRGLQPGVLYNTTVRPHVCRSHGPALHVLVRTDAQTIDATARLTNIRFTADLWNSSSWTYKNTSERIKEAMFQPLSAEMKAMMDSGQVRVEIRGFSPGSVVVNFTVVVAPGQSQDVSSVSSALLLSLTNSTIYTVDGNDTSIEDYDECATGDNDCSQRATCSNTRGSYACSCLDGYEDVSPERPGRACQGDATLKTGSTAVPAFSSAPFSQVKASTHEPTLTPLTLPTTTNTTDATPGNNTTANTTTTSTLPTAGTGPFTRNVSVLAAISVQCRVAAITVTAERGFLLENNIRDGALYLGLPECGVNGGNATHAELTVAWDECGTRLVHNDTYYTASVTLFNHMDSYISPSGRTETPRTRLEVPVMCIYKKSMLLSSDFGSMGYDTIKDIVVGMGSFQATVALSNGTVPLSCNHSLSPQEEVVMELSVNASSERIKTIVNKCWATPSPNPADTYSYTFLDNSCPLNAFTRALVNGKSNKARVSVKIFSLVNLTVVYLHCQVQVCVPIGSDTCAINCLQRAALSVNTLGTASSSAGPLQRSAEQPPEPEYDTVHVVGLSCLGVGLSLFFIVGFACLFYCQRNRIGHYNFTVNNKQENFTVLVLNA